MLEWGPPRDRAACAVLAVHGRGQDPGFMRDTAARFGAVNARFYAPEAPGSSWYPHPFLVEPTRNQPALGRSLSTIGTCVERLGEQGFGPERVVLWGFSQGACLLSQYLLTVAPRAYGGAALFTGGYLGPGSVPPPAGNPLRGLNVVLRSIEHDPFVPSRRVEETAAVLTKAGASVDLRIDPGDEHMITGEACAAAARLLGSVVPMPAAPGS
ncbi:phospholipase [Amycolatopsis sp. K13G38]|uniref:Phospholipase n=1 Tax=Amycolatopsis acididurans TaxID=2724524 RepID=A0ABX1IZ55_9PSEU|nr:phospholipase [Amycolatopsis acididurans]NKQ51385.1 phospholipase [Amycolatopsis acididurans]